MRTAFSRVNTIFHWRDSLKHDRDFSHFVEVRDIHLITHRARKRRPGMIHQTKWLSRRRLRAAKPIPFCCQLKACQFGAHNPGWRERVLMTGATSSFILWTVCARKTPPHNLLAHDTPFPEAAPNRGIPLHQTNLSTAGCQNERPEVQAFVPALP